MPDENENVNELKKSIESIIGAKTQIRKPRKTTEDLQREQFINLIKSLEALLNRSDKINEYLDMVEYDQPFYQVMDYMFILMFGEETHQVISWFLYGQYNEDGSVIDLVDEKDKIVPIKTPEDLWNFIKSKAEKKTKKK